MAKPKFLSLDGARTLVQWAKDQLATKVDKVAGKDLSDNNYSDDDVAKLESIENGSQSNIIESISVNNVAQAIDDKNVNIAIPLVDDTLTNAGQSADAKATGDAIAEVNQSLSQTATAIRQEFDDADNQLAQEMTQALEDLSTTIPTKTSELTNDSDYTTKGYVDDEISGVEAEIPTKTSELTNDSDYTTKQYVDGELGTLEASIPTKVSQLQNDSSYATTTQLTDAVGDITSFDFQVVTELPATGTKGVIYLVAHTHDTNDVYDEYIWITDEYERLGTLDVDLSGYATIQYVDDELDKKIDDVQVGGISVVTDGVAEIPVADIDSLGVVKIKPAYGVGIINDFLMINSAVLDEIKLGGTSVKPISPHNQHNAVFYGLAKAAGYDEKDSTLEVGIYTDEAKSAIQTMLGVDTAISSAIDNLVNTRYHVCEPGEYNSTTYIPTLAGELGVIYLVPKPIGDTGIDNDSITGTAQIGTATIAATNNIFYEYIYTGTKFEQIGDTKVDLTGYLTDADIATDASVTTMLNQVFS